MITLKAREGVVPSYHNLSIDGVNLSVRPTGWRHIFRFWHYSQGDRVKFRIEVKDKSQTSPLGRIAIYEDLLLPKDSEKERTKVLRGFKILDTADLILDGFLIHQFL